MLLRKRIGRHVRESDRYRWWVLWTALAGLFATGFTITILAVSLGDVARDLGASETALTWTVTGPFLALALSMPLFGKIGDVRGHRRVYLIGLAGFTVATFLTALAWNGSSLIAIRTLGAIPGAATGPASMALIMRAFPEEDRVKAMGWWSLVGAGAPVLGLVAGGPLVDAIGWRAIFLLQTPIALAALIVAIPILHETPRLARQSIDYAGAVSLAAATVSALLGLSVGSQIGWTQPAVLGLFAAESVALAMFAAIERRAQHPLLPLRFFTERNFTASLVAQFTSNFGYMGGFIVTPLLMERVFGFTVAATSLAMICRPLSFSVSSPVAGYVAVRAGERRRVCSAARSSSCRWRASRSVLRRRRLRSSSGRWSCRGWARRVATVVDQLGGERGRDGESRRRECGPGDGHPDRRRSRHPGAVHGPRGRLEHRVVHGRLPRRGDRRRRRHRRRRVRPVGGPAGPTQRGRSRLTVRRWAPWVGHRH
jgi:MFS family permease